MRKVLIANRGEIACRIMASCRALGLRTVAVHSEADTRALHVERADQAVAIGPAKPAESYLNAARLIDAARRSGADAVHPGYGFLAESAAFAEKVIAAGLIWIGPAPRTIADMGDKERARRMAGEAGVPVAPGSRRFAPGDADGLAAAAGRVGFPLLVKAAAGGGGIGMRRVDRPDALPDVVAATQAMAAKSFGDGTIYLERLVAPARHVEVQVFGFGDGRVIHLYERDCSIQRRYQKIVEESRAPRLAPETAARMAQAAVALAAAQRYAGAGTVEFIVGPDEHFHFLEMNTRIQVEHPVTEMLTGLDIVALQLRLAAGDPLAELSQEAVRAAGHAVEARVCAEAPERNFLPSPGRLTVFRPPPAEADLRIDAGVREGDQVTIHYDPLIAKVIARGATRDEALDRLSAALGRFEVQGVHTNIAFLRRLLAHPGLRAGGVSTGFAEASLGSLAQAPADCNKRRQP